MKPTTWILTAVLVLAVACSTPPATSASTSPLTPAGSPTSPVASAPATASPSARPGFATHEHAILGYRLSLPVAYRRLNSQVHSGAGETLGAETYTRRTELEERELCLRSPGGIPPRDWETDIVILTWRNTNGESAAQWASNPRVPDSQAMNAQRTMQPVTVNGRDAVRLVWQRSGETAGYVIPANDRVYVIMPAVASQPSGLPHGWIDDIATSFLAITPQPFPAPSPSPSPTPRCGG